MTNRTKGNTMIGLSSKGKEIARDLAAMDEVKELAKPPALETTRHHYGHYASVIDKLSVAIMPDLIKQGHYLVAAALKEAGATKQGVDDAMFSFFGYPEFDPMTRMFA